MKMQKAKAKFEALYEALIAARTDDLPYRKRRKLTVLIDAVGAEIDAINTQIVAKNSGKYAPLSKELKDATAELKWAKNTVEAFTAAARKTETIAAMAARLLVQLA